MTRAKQLVKRETVNGIRVSTWKYIDNTGRVVDSETIVACGQKKAHGGFGARTTEDAERHHERMVENVAAGNFDTFFARAKEQQVVRSLREYRDWRKAVLIRDNHTCQGCGKHWSSFQDAAFDDGASGFRPEVDHIESFDHHPERRFDPDNGRTLCHECHAKTDNYGSRVHAKEFKMQVLECVRRTGPISISLIRNETGLLLLTVWKSCVELMAEGLIKYDETNPCCWMGLGELVVVSN